MEGAGFEPAKPVRAPDLQSGGFNHSPTPPFYIRFCPGPIPGIGEPQRGLEPLTCRLQIGCAANCATGAQRPNEPAINSSMYNRHALKRPRQVRGRPVFASSLFRLRKLLQIVNCFQAAPRAKYAKGRTGNRRLASGGTYAFLGRRRGTVRPCNRNYFSLPFPSPPVDGEGPSGPICLGLLIGQSLRP